VSLTGLNASSTHGWHIHGAPILNQNCTTGGAHFNPLNTTHGDRTNDAQHRHYGDLGNIVADADGKIEFTMTDPLVSLYGTYSVATFGLVIHEKIDDLGLGNATTSKTVGNSGSRLACGNIILKELAVSSAVAVTSSYSSAVVSATYAPDPYTTQAPASAPAYTTEAPAAAPAYTTEAPVAAPAYTDAAPASNSIYSSARGLDMAALLVLPFVL
ncbi:Superoxide dismutase [Cu-Zn], partial [Kappamyces sp. JEL0680]